MAAASHASIVVLLLGKVCIESFGKICHVGIINKSAKVKLYLELQGMTLPHVIIASWGYFAKNWPYVVLSRSTTFKGLYLFEPIDMEKSFAPSRDLIEYLRRAENLQDHILEMRKTRMAEVNRKNRMSMMS